MQLETIRVLLEQQQLDALLITSDYNRLWYTTFFSTAGYLLITKTKVFFLLDGRYFEAGKEQAQNVDEVILIKNILEQLNGLLANNKIKNLGFEKEYVTYEVYEYLQESLKCVIKPAPIKTLRIKKNKDEIIKLKKAADIGDEAYKAVIKKIKPQMTEKQVERIIVDTFLKHGGEKPSFDTIVASGWRSSLPHGRATNKVINANEIITCDFGVVYQGYCSDMTRTFVIGTDLDEKLVDVYNVVMEAQRLGVEAIKPGIMCNEIDKICRDYIVSKGYGEYFSHGTGHGLGIEIHEEPYVTASSETILEAGMVITVEPGIYIPQLGGVRIEDDILVTKTGYEILTKSPRELSYIKIEK